MRTGEDRMPVAFTCDENGIGRILPRKGRPLSGRAAARSASFKAETMRRRALGIEIARYEHVRLVDLDSVLVTALLLGACTGGLHAAMSRAQSMSRGQAHVVDGAERFLEAVRVAVLGGVVDALEEAEVNILRDCRWQSADDGPVSQRAHRCRGRRRESWRGWRRARWGCQRRGRRRCRW